MRFVIARFGRSFSAIAYRWPAITIFEVVVEVSAFFTVCVVKPAPKARLLRISAMPWRRC
jgi:hypothetical protein